MMIFLMIALIAFCLFLVITHAVYRQTEEKKQARHNTDVVISACSALYPPGASSQKVPCTCYAASLAKSSILNNIRGMLVIKCAACKRKLWKYDKIGRGQVLRCYKDRITRRYTTEVIDGKVKCLCGKDIGIDKGTHIKMISKAFTHTGTKRNG